MANRSILLALIAVMLLLASCTAGKSCDIKDQAPQATDPQRQGRLQGRGDGTCQDFVTGKIWQVTKSKRIKSQAAANHYVEELRLAGKSDWRLPTLAELYQLFLLVDSHGLGDCPMDFGGNYWSADVDQKGRVGAWELDGECHPEREYVPKAAGYIRAVRP